jgi:metal-responsive CopG/Arc/MetJ family transcriptional regulator
MTIITIRIDEKLKKKMDKMKHINWSEVVRQAISNLIDKEESMRSRRQINLERVMKAAREQDKLRAKTTGSWSGTEEIRKWRDLRR